MENRHFKKFKTIEERNEYLSCQNIDSIKRDFVSLVKFVNEGNFEQKQIDYLKEDETIRWYETESAHIIDYGEDYTNASRYSLGWVESKTCDGNIQIPCTNPYMKIFTTEYVKVKLTNVDKGQWVIYERDFPIGGSQELDPDKFVGYPVQSNLGEESLSVLGNTAFMLRQMSIVTPGPFVPGQVPSFNRKLNLLIDLFLLNDEMIETHPWANDTNFTLEVFVQPFTCKEYEPTEPDEDEPELTPIDPELVGGEELTEHSELT